jgi:hypothetical protein
VSVAPLKPNPALTAEVEWPFETPAPGSGEEAMVRALWLHRMQEANRLWAQVWAEEVAASKARIAAGTPHIAPRQPKRIYTDTMQGALQADDDIRQETNQDEWEYGS